MPSLSHFYTPPMYSEGHEERFWKVSVKHTGLQPSQQSIPLIRLTPTQRQVCEPALAPCPLSLPLNFLLCSFYPDLALETENAFSFKIQ